MNEYISALITNCRLQSNGSVLMLSTEALSRLGTVYFHQVGYLRGTWEPGSHEIIELTGNP